MPTPAPCPPRTRKLLVLALALFALAGVSAQQPEPLIPIPIPTGLLRPPTPSEVLAFGTAPQPLELPGGNSAPLPVPPLPPLPGGPALPHLPAVPTAPAAPVVPPRYVNKPDVEFDFEVTKKGRAGVKAAKLLLYAASNPIKTWTTVTEEVIKPDLPQKLRYKLKSDGRYEFVLRLVGENGRESRNLPDKGEPAEFVVVLDTEPPVVKDVRLEPPANGEKQAVIRWTATDANLGEKCVTLEYEQKAGGVWGKIADGLSNSGSYSWALDDKLPVSTRVRVTVTDLAGNSTAVMSDAPTNLDSVVPEGRLTGVRAVDPPPVQELDPDWGSPRLVAPPPRLVTPKAFR